MTAPAKPAWNAFLPTWLKAETTPDRLRFRAVLVVLTLIIVGSMSWALTNRLVNATNDVAENVGEILIATQQVSASFAEADAAAASVHLAGSDGNREQRRLFEQALERATASLERVASLLADDDDRSHEALQIIGARTVEYAGLVEAARVQSIEDLSGADSTLRQASEINREEISPQLQVIAERTRWLFAHQTDSGYYVRALIFLGIGLVVLLGAQYGMYRRFRRFLNVPLALATLVVLALVIFSVRGVAAQQGSFDNAEQQAFDAITVSEQLQQDAYRHRALLTTSVLANSPTAALAEIEERIEGASGLLQQAVDEASSDRERAAATAISTRWARYRNESDTIQQTLAAGDVEAAEFLTQGQANSAFNGFNTSVEAALLDNREQFLDQLDAAKGSLHELRFAVLFGSLVAALLAWSGYAFRIGEYR